MNTPPHDPLVHDLMQANQLIADQKLAEAAQSLNRLQARSPHDPRIYLLGMRLAEAAGNPAAALKSAQRAVELSPQWHVSTMELGALYSRQQRHSEAVATARTALRLAPGGDRETLARAAAIAAEAGDHPAVVDWTQQALSLGDVSTDRSRETLMMRYNLAAALQQMSRHEEAAPMFNELVEIVPDSPGARIGAILCARAMNDKAAEQAHATRLLELDPGREEYQYAHAVAHGETPKTQPEATVAELFDNYAERFDIHLVKGLQYRVPEIVTKRLLELYPDRHFNLLDLGCGTGLLVIFLGPINGAMVGVDLSENMLKQAARTRLYACLHHVNVMDALRATPSEQYEVIVCNDVFIYVGDLSEAIPNALRILKPGGHFIFSCETAGEDEADLVLRQRSNRYAHKASAVERDCRAAGFVDVEIQHLDKLRMEGAQPLPGFIVYARKAA